MILKIKKEKKEQSGGVVFLMVPVFAWDRWRHHRPQRVLRRAHEVGPYAHIVAYQPASSTSGVRGPGVWNWGAGMVLSIYEVEAQRGVHRALDARNADLAVALGRVGVAAGEERAGHLHRQALGCSPS